jgi:WD40 repeat protein
MRLWDAKSGDLIAVLRGHSGMPWSSFTRDSSRLVSSGEDGTVRFWDRNLVERNGVLRGHTRFVYDVAFSPDGALVASVAWDGTARIWDATTGQQSPPLLHPQPYVTSLAYSHDGHTLATANTQNGIVLWDLETRQSQLAVPLDWHARVTLSPDGRLLACGDFRRNLVVLYDTAAKQPLAELRYDEPDVPLDRKVTGDPLFSPDGATLVTTGGGGKVLLWDAASRKVRGSLPEYTGGAYRFAFSADSKFLAVGAISDNSLRIWNQRTLEPLAAIKVGNPVLGLAFSPDGTRLAAGCRDNTIRLIDVATWQEVAELRGHTDYVHAVAWSPDGTRLVSGSGDGTVRIWDSLSVQERAKKSR